MRIVIVLCYRDNFHIDLRSFSIGVRVDLFVEMGGETGGNKRALSSNDSQGRILGQRLRVSNRLPATLEQIFLNFEANTPSST